MKIIWKPGTPLLTIETLTIYAALKHHDGNKNKAAKDLRISLRKLRNVCRDRDELQAFYVVPNKMKSRFN